MHLRRTLAHRRNVHRRPSCCCCLPQFYVYGAYHIAHSTMIGRSDGMFISQSVINPSAQPKETRDE